MERLSDKDIVALFIEKYKDLPCLWDVNHPCYRLKSRRIEALTKLVAILKQNDPEADINVVRRKIDTLRTGYYREKRRILQSMEEAGTEEEIRITSLWYYDLMSFLPEVTYRRHHQILKHEDLDRQNYECLNPDGSEEEKISTPQVKRPRVSSQTNFAKNYPLCDDTSQNSMLQQYFTQNYKYEKNENDDQEEFDAFGKFVALELKKLQNPEQTIAQKFISDVIYFAKLGKIKPDSIMKIVSNEESPDDFPGSTSPEYLVEEMLEEKYDPLKENVEDG